MRHTLSARDRGNGFACPYCGTSGEPYRYSTRPGVLCCRACRHETRLTAGTVMERTHTPLSVWFWAAYFWLPAIHPECRPSSSSGQLGLSRYETAFQILHKLRAGMVRPNQDQMGASPRNTSRPTKPMSVGVPAARGEAYTTWFSWPARSKSASASSKGAVTNARTGRYAGRVRLAVAPDRSAKSLGGFIERTVAPGATIITDDWSGYAKLGERDYCHTAIAGAGRHAGCRDLPARSFTSVFSNLKTWLRGIHPRREPTQHLQA